MAGRNCQHGAVVLVEEAFVLVYLPTHTIGFVTQNKLDGAIEKFWVVQCWNLLSHFSSSFFSGRSRYCIHSWHCNSWVSSIGVAVAFWGKLEQSAFHSLVAKINSKTEQWRDAKAKIQHKDKWWFLNAYYVFYSRLRGGISPSLSPCKLRPGPFISMQRLCLWHRDELYLRRQDGSQDSAWIQVSVTFLTPTHSCTMLMLAVLYFIAAIKNFVPDFQRDSMSTNTNAFCFWAELNWIQTSHTHQFRSYLRSAHDLITLSCLALLSVFIWN